MQAARWQEVDGGRVRCTLCPRRCRLGPGQAGFCRVRRNDAGAILSLAYGHPTGFAVDPIEKKPLHHFFPGSFILSFGTLGCNLACRFCQNWHLSAARPRQRGVESYAPDDVVDLAVEAGAPAIAFTYNDPVIWAEYAIDVAKAAHARGLRTVFVTAGYVEERAREEIFAHMDAANVDLKAFSEGFYRRLALGHLEPVLETLAWLARSRVWTEVTNLVIPGHNDDPAETRALASWIGEHMGADTPLHFSAFHPSFRLLDAPPTPAATLTRARALAREVGLRHVYTGNVRDPDGQSTRCSGCGELLVARAGLGEVSSRLRGARCPRCRAALPGRFAEA